MRDRKNTPQPEPEDRSRKAAQTMFLRASNKDLEDSTSSFRKMIKSFVETVHAPVVFKSAKVTKCVVETLDGSDDCGKNGENIESLTLRLSNNWEGGISGMPGKSVIDFTIYVADEDGDWRFISSDAMNNFTKKEIRDTMSQMMGWAKFFEAMSNKK